MLGQDHTGTLERDEITRDLIASVCHLSLLCDYLCLVERCMSAMQEGTQMVKLRGSSKGLVRFYYLDEHRSCLRWRPSRKNEKAKSKSAT